PKMTKAARQSCAPYSAKLLNCRVCLGLPTGSTDKCVQEKVPAAASAPKTVTSAVPNTVTSAAPAIVSSATSETLPSAAPETVPSATPAIVAAVITETIPSSVPVTIAAVTPTPTIIDDFADVTSIPLDDFEYDF
ncbi:hypothetical protein BGX29_005552, partial [Mortierella sp. GBA35]